MEIVYIGLVILVIFMLYVIILYNILVAKKIKISEAFSIMDVQLKKRWDLIPNLVSVVKGYAKHEADVLERVTELRQKDYSEQNINKKIEINKEIGSLLSTIMVKAEAYPELKANEEFMRLTKTLIAVEDEIAISRKYYNATVREYNTIKVIFPNNIIVKMFKMEDMKMFEIDNQERKNVNTSI